ncbi:MULTISPECIES: Ig-like domain-containing protein, partial [unclassified Ensifer]
MVSSAVLNNHANVAINQESGTIAAPNGPANFLLSTDQKSVSNYVRQGDDLTIEFADGRVLRVQGFFANGADFNNLVFVHDGERWLTNFSQALGSGGDGLIDPLVAYERITEGNSTAALLGILGAAAAGGAIAAVSGGDDDPEPRDTTAPNAPTLVAMDDKAPVVGPIANNSKTNDSTPTLSGTGEAGSTIKVYDNGKLIGTTIVGADGRWTFTPQVPLADGAHEVTVTATDKANNTSQASPKLVIVVDTIAPSVPSVNGTDDKAPITGPISNGGTTNDTTPTLKGAAEPGALVTIFDNGVEIGTARVNSEGSWHFTPTTPLREGPHSITATVTDEAGNVSSPSAVLTFTVDATSPLTAPTIGGLSDDRAPVIGQVVNGGFTNDETPRLAGSGAEPDSTVNIYDKGALIGSVKADGSGNWSFTPATPLSEGAHSLTTTNVDKAGNEGPASAPFVFTVDTTAPAVPAAPASYADDAGAIQNPANTAATTDDTTPGINIGTVPAGTTPSLYVDGVKVPAAYDAATGTLTPVNVLPEGAHQISYSLTDAAGNESAPSAPLAVTVDTTAPATPAAPASYADNAGPVQNPASTAATTDDTTPGINIGTVPAGTTPSLYVDGTKVDATYDAATGTLTPVNVLPEGAHQLSYTLTDAAGNESAPSAPLSVTVDTTVPATPAAPASYADNAGSVQDPASTAATTDDPTPGINIGTVPAGTTPSLYVDGVKVPATYDAATGTLTPVNVLPEGAHQISYSLTDTAGNESAPSVALSVTVDTTAPTAPAAPASYADNAGSVQDPASTAATTDDTTPGINIGTVPAGTTP